VVPDGTSKAAPSNTVGEFKRENAKHKKFNETRETVWDFFACFAFSPDKFPGFFEFASGIPSYRTPKTGFSYHQPV
jgi:hypothetical protein